MMDNTKLWLEHDLNHIVYDNLVERRIRLLNSNPDLAVNEYKAFKNEEDQLNAKSISIKKKLGVLASSQYIICHKCHNTFRAYKSSEKDYKKCKDHGNKEAISP